MLQFKSWLQTHSQKGRVCAYLEKARVVAVRFQLSALPRVHRSTSQLPAILQGTACTRYGRVVGCPVGHRSRDHNRVLGLVLHRDCICATASVPRSGLLLHRCHGAMEEYPGRLLSGAKAQC